MQKTHRLARAELVPNALCKWLTTECESNMFSHSTRRALGLLGIGASETLCSDALSFLLILLHLSSFYLCIHFLKCFQQ